jgi:probable chromosome-partitioning protein parB
VSAKKGLGRGFDSLIPSDLFDESFDPTGNEDKRVSEMREIPLAQIRADDGQPRRQFDDEALQELADSITEHGVLQPIVVVPQDGEFIIVAGERRYRASQLAGLETIPAIVRTLSAQNRLELALIENLQRRDLNPLETATAFAKLRDQFNLSLEQIAARVGKRSASAVSNTMRLLKLPKSVQKAVYNGELSEGQARPLIGLEEEEALKIVHLVITRGLSARQIEELAGKHKANARRKEVKTNPEPVQRYLLDREERAAQRFGTAVQFKVTARGNGRIVIPFKNQAELDRISKLLDEQ